MMNLFYNIEEGLYVSQHLILLHYTIACSVTFLLLYISFSAMTVRPSPLLQVAIRNII